uniref:C2H2-type domain-containing protein n=1 Tax=Neogobius melanostomus TaxID=47308 RepID=A0A8C6X098_9GOBI
MERRNNKRLFVKTAGETRALFERTTAECEEELRRSQDENRRKQRLLEQILSPRVVLVRVDTGQSLKREITETSRIKEEPEEQSVTHEEEQLPVCFPESSAVSVKREEPSPLPQRQTERGNISSEPHFRSETEGHTEHSSDTDDDDEDWEPPFSRSDAQMETEADGENHHNQVQSRSTKVSAQNKSAPETSATVDNGETSGADGGEEKKKHQCHVCDKKFRKKQNLTTHIRVHTGERPYCCSTCKKTFNQIGALNSHRRTHTGEKPHDCSFCNKTFAHKHVLDVHRRTHTGERPYSCQVCEKKFTHLSNLNKHGRTHTGERPYCCLVCQKTFTFRFDLKRHMKTHSV